MTGSTGVEPGKLVDAVDGYQPDIIKGRLAAAS
jgi:hypothetical protein